MSGLELRELTAADEAAFVEGANRFKGESPHWYSFLWSTPGMTYAAMLDRLRKDRLGEELRDGRVPHTMFYGFIDGAIVGRISVRHRLNVELSIRGGHIGYAVAPALRGRGYATAMVRQALPHCRALGNERVLVTCDDDNAASWRIIERVGGVLERVVDGDGDHKAFRRYWLDLPPRATPPS